MQASSWHFQVLSIAELVPKCEDIAYDWVSALPQSLDWMVAVEIVCRYFGKV